MAEKANSLVRAELGLKGGQTLALRLSEAEFKKLRKACEGDGWQDFDAEGGAVSIDLGQVTFVRVDSDEFTVGF